MLFPAALAARPEQETEPPGMVLIPTLLNQNNEPVKLSSFLGKKNVALAFSGQALTGGAVREIKAYIVDSQFIAATDTEIVGISEESPPVIKKFADETGARFNLLSDPRGEVARTYSVFLERWDAPRRSTFIIDKQGIIRYIEQGAANADSEGALAFCLKAFVHKEASN